MKKVLIGIIALLAIIAGAGYAWYNNAYGGESYYVKITADGQKTTEKDDSGKTFYRYAYDLTAANDKGETKKLDFTADHNLRHDAYLQLTDNKQKGVTNWKEVSKDKVPSSALTKIGN